MVPRDIFPKLKANIKLGIREDGDGKEVEVEVRENEEQSIKFQEIIDLLVAAGYFRARIKGLSPFDKVVGGMTWCIESCNIDVDVDFLFQENATIGQKIALTEKIVAVLPKMKCPYGIEPHQIQGLDFIHIFPVIQWLVKTSLEFRQETFEFVRKNAINQFNKSFTLEEEINDQISENKMYDNLKKVKLTYRPKRQYRLKHLPPKEEIDRVQVTLLEYGFKGAITKVTDSKSDSQDPTVTAVSSNTQPNEEDYDPILTSEEKAELQKHYVLLQAEISDGGVRTREERQLAKIKAQHQIFEDRIEKLKMKKQELETSIAEGTESLQEIKNMKNEAISRLKQIEESSKENGSDIGKLEELILINENLREQENQFKEQCRNELDRLQKMIQDTKNNVEKKPVSTELQQQLDDIKQKVQNQRLTLAKRNRVIAAYQRQLDDIPSRAELAQYQRRFLELYNQVASKHKETKQYFTLYNTLNDTKMYISKELSLLNSIFDNYPEAMCTNTGKEEFLNELNRIVESVKQTKAKVETRCAEEQNSRDNLSNQLQGLIAEQRKYVALVRQLSIECRRNEALIEELKHS
ncbi:coiled-coil domain-containing protein 93 isoform X2 [Chrysoperla carnea]|uniref:coiled-coil domain-containing protein 93 isoform X2 n=1 Tax=Chrysoperla carnea TaxID=189513 RepID=UPI001D062835|nr:coiled-coil domain-containing protein 93 isoform X2 [Chrysoperla carnea]